MNDLQSDYIAHDDDNVKIRILFFGALTFVWTLFPLASVALIICLIYFTKLNISAIKYCCFLIALSFGLIAYTAVSVDRGVDPTDLVRYTEQFRALSNTHTLPDFLITAVTLNGGVYLIFDSVTWALALLFPSNPQVMPLFWVTIAYFFLLLGIIELSSIGGVFSKKIFLVLLLLALFGLTLFTQEVELLKQSSSTSVAAYAIFRKLNCRRNNLIFFIIALMIHTSVIIFIPVFFLFKKDMINRYYIFLLFFSILISQIDINRAISIFGSGVLAEKAEHYTLISNWSVTKINYTMFSIYAVLLSLIIYEKIKTEKFVEKKQWMFNLNILLFCMMLTQFSSTHNIVRYTYLYSPFYILAFLFIFTGKLQTKDKLTFTSVFCILAVCINVSYTIFYLDSVYTNSYMDNSALNLLSSNLYTFLTYSAVN